MRYWSIRPLVYGTIEVKKEQLTTGLDVGLPITVPYMGFYLTNGCQKVVCDTGINAKYIVNGKAWAGSPAAGGEDWVLRSLSEIGVEAKEIEMVIYTHLHNDHAGNCHLFPNARHIFQDAEWKELLDPLPSMRIRGDYDQSLIFEMQNLCCQRVAGDVTIMEGLRLMLTPGHTAGSQCVLVDTRQGVYNVAGDTVHILPIAFPQMTVMTLMDKTTIPITPAPRHWGAAVPSSLVYNHYEWFRSMYRIQAELSGPEYLIAGHEPSIVGKIFG